jgi:cyclopropane fatty-acyl-phospholipid synthase-like methyltransferase
MGSTNGERQIGKSNHDIAGNHISRYKWAVDMLSAHLPEGATVLDAACGCAYGSKMIAKAGFNVHAYDKSVEAQQYSAHFSHDRVKFFRANIFDAAVRKYDAIVSLETIEHIQEDQEWVALMKKMAPLVVATVPNEDVIHFNPSLHKHHVRHYTRPEVEELFSGWSLSDWHTQDGKRENHTMRPGDDSHTLGFVAKR